MLAQFSIWPMDRPHMSEDIAGLTKVLDKFAVRYEVGPIGTTLEGEWDEVMNAIRSCHEKLRDSHQRVLTTITVDDDATRTLGMSESVDKVAQRRHEVNP